ncbi:MULTISPECIES: D-Ala-D-Ala carboxypeptidase family metallohydrolase [Hyphobacterium]|uniref:D-Ala-D-Ala carboxypeptidase family metallohydrolase n=1 Tax=Hyphobacterium vulgare TaxID=1736751 RepID=A0ABV6ZV83_9PROT
MKTILTSLFWLTAAASAASASDMAPAREPVDLHAYDNGRTGLTVSVNDTLSVDYRVFALSVMPGEMLTLSADRPVEWRSERPFADGLGEAAVWLAPDQPGLHAIEAVAENGEIIRLNVFVLRPASEIRNGQLSGYRIGDYPREPYRGLDTYRAPEGYIEVTQDMIEIEVAPHFMLGQFLCKQEAGWPRYAVVREDLLLSLEDILERVNAHGWRTDGFVVMSGYRTPDHNRDLRNGEHSRHVYGGAADIFIDEDGDKVMDDLNGDGIQNQEDAAVLFDFIHALMEDEASGLAGGLGEYRANGYHGPYVHIDERGFNVRWGR